MFRKEISLLQWLGREIKSAVVIFVLFPLAIITLFLFVVEVIKTGMIWWALSLIVLLFVVLVFIEWLMIKKTRERSCSENKTGNGEVEN